MRNTVIVEGIGDLRDAFGMILEDGWIMNPPEPTTRFVDVPGRWPLDLTDAMGGPFYGNRQQSFVFGLFNKDHELAVREAIRTMHGKRLRYSVSMDPDHMYEGRWSLSEINRGYPGFTSIKATVVADPYRYRPDMTLRLNPVGGRWYTLECGDMPVRPTIECETPVRVDFNGKSTLVGAGSWQLNNVLLTKDSNRIYLNSWEVHDATWNYIAENGQHPLIWDEADWLSWDELEGLATIDGGATSTGSGITWTDAMFMTWDEAEQLTWDEVEWMPSTGVTPASETTVYLTYKIGDL